MIEFLFNLDREVFLFLNNLGTESWDGFWLLVTKQFNWIPIFLIILYLVHKHYGWRHALLIIGMISLLILITDQTTNQLFKFRFERLRPGSDPSLDGLMRAVKTSSTFSFISGHASNSMAACFFLYTVLKTRVKYIEFMFLWPLIFAYSRIYLGLHYPGDILIGYLWGIIMALLVLKLYVILRDKYFPNREEIDVVGHVKL
ncbi:phosphatase PAP2 family protein [Flavobacterium tegetincola]|uniref:phosphatase PAP2 family protein n=1 Tax=Flavobacterium tegetincola TaxID=150172 RepID=UPI0004237A61|nr:phosphatase PAP2 family protein [Flavobacterium tegetincola]